MNTVGEFFEKIYLNEHHAVRVKSAESDQVICEFDNLEGMQTFAMEDRVIKEFATDWEKRIYILWI